jgi:hypothetical protein
MGPVGPLPEHCELTAVWRDDLDASGPTINLRRDRSVWIMFLLIASCNS